MTHSLTHSLKSALTSSLVSAAFLATALCATPLLAQQAVPVESPTGPSPADATATPQSDQASPGVRIVRLSQVNGDVQLDRQTGHGFEVAFANLPIIQGGRLRTGDAVAEVEFEDNSSLRLTPNSLVEFPVLSLGSDGTRTSTIHVVQGAIYISLTKSKQNNVNVTFGRETLALGPSAHIALTLTGKQPRLDVLDGTVQAVNGATTTTVDRKKALLFDPTGTSAPTLVSKNEKSAYDDWDKQAVDYHQRLAPTNGNYAATPYAYGLADMNYYGGFNSLGGCGTMWQPYLASANWSPYDNGVWAWYPNAGYSWVSPYPWGWTAFHSGSWNYCPGAGWGWQPGNQWNGLRNTPLLGLPTGPRRLKPPPGKPVPFGATMVAVNQKPLVASKLNEKDTFVFRKDSAGFGVPRSTFGKLNHISSSVVQHGSVERAVYVSSTPGTRPQENQSRMATNGTASHTMPAGSHSAIATHSSSSAVSSGSGGHSASSGSFSGGGASMGGSAGGGHSSGGGHH
ncbi:MAG TPA: DUF6600 domain-containing protein [Acidobacteriaceae bacterium]|nr:DUF6600 domain-containing protein [Acidobacteriaceae bacterium]